MLYLLQTTNLGQACRSRLFVDPESVCYFCKYQMMKGGFADILELGKN